MRQYTEGQAILPGLVYETRDDDDEHAVKFTGTGEINIVTTQDIEHLESIADELADLRARVPTEWRTGVPDWASLNPKDWMARRYKDGGIGCGSNSVSWCLDNQNNLKWEEREYCIIPYVAPPAPEKPKTLTAADLPTFDGRVKWEANFFDRTEEDTPWSVDATIGSYNFGTDFFATEHEAVQAALDAIAAGKLDRWLGGAE